ncbi:MAG: alanine:cation symporter family protein [Treponema sp.]|uniref:alanine/glycine:cation symporter family protein n=1 Tax=Treponema sp. TaxID=166 RepID=UPI0025E5A7A9|nr:alanine/glycine:cation symporter family protein [Treponema sp.]MBQ8678295.1 alanine:cation symporter family protein [Treponema sp.]
MFDQILNSIDDVVWGIPTIVLILATGLVLTIRARGLQFTKLGRAFRSIFKENEGHGELSGFSALCTALSATIGTGNIVGVATAIAAGGPGALFWMWIAAILGTATKFSECMLAIKFREVKEDGHVLGGPFYTIEKGMGAKWKWLAILFAVFGVLAGLLGIGTMTQINGITSAVNMAFDPNNANIAFTIGDKPYTWATVIGGAIVTICAALVILGGLKRISKVAEKVVPAMAVIYIFMGVAVLIMNATKVPAAFALIFKSAFGAGAITAGVSGYIIKMILDSMQKGIARGIFSNEAGLGSAPIAAAPVQTNEPVEQGLVNMTGTVIDTLIVCTMTGLAIVIAFYGDIIAPGGIVFETVEGKLAMISTWNHGLEGASLTAAAFSRVLGGDGYSVKFLLMLCLAFFAFTTILGWDYYSEKCLEYLTNGRMKLVFIYRLIYIAAIAIGPYFTVNAVFTIADITNGLMAIPNCISLIVLSGVVAEEVKKYFAKYPTL